MPAAFVPLMGAAPDEPFLGVPIGTDWPIMGAVVLFGAEESSSRRSRIDQARLLSLLVHYVLALLDRDNSWASQVLRQAAAALRRLREELRLTQAELGEMVGTSRTAISRWEAGAQPPSIGPLFRWCRALGVLASSRGTLVTVVDVTPKLLRMLKEEPERLRQLSPSQFERFVADRLDRMGFDVELTGRTALRDGGIDLIAVPKIRTVASFLLAGQVKHHCGSQKSGRGTVDRLLAWQNSQFRLGLLVTNTDFTRDARWLADQERNRAFLRLRSFEDLKRWLEDNYASESEWREIPEHIVLAPGVRIAVPRPRLILPKASY